MPEIAPDLPAPGSTSNVPGPRRHHRDIALTPTDPHSPGAHTESLESSTKLPLPCHPSPQTQASRGKDEIQGQTDHCFQRNGASGVPDTFSGTVPTPVRSFLEKFLT